MYGYVCKLNPLANEIALFHNNIGFFGLSTTSVDSKYFSFMIPNFNTNLNISLVKLNEQVETEMAVYFKNGNRQVSH